MQRRDFLRGSVMAGTAFAFSHRRLWAQSSDAHVEILVNEPVGVISPNIYGHFTEHIGGVIYDGVWVGPDSRIPNKYGIRSALLDRLKEIGTPIIRWPGGCFADSYDWKDGIGPAANRPKRTNFWEVDPDAARMHHKGPQVFEPNSFGTNEFIQFCRLTGAEPYLAANLRSLSASEFDHWVEYCNSPAGSTTLAEMRSAAGFPDPFRVRYWGVGNESWGCGGNFAPEEYASEFRRFTTWVPSFDLAVHHYSWNLSRGKTQDWIKGKGDALTFDSVDWYELLRESSRIEQILNDHWAAMGQYDTAHRVKLVVDEYGPWYRQGSEVDLTHIFGQQITMRDALATALTLDTFNRNADKVMMATCAQLVNNLNALFLAHEDRFISTPNFHVFAMYAAHQGAQALRAEISTPDIRYSRDGEPASFWGLKGSASRKGNTVTLTAVNPDVAKAKDVQITLYGGKVKNASGVALAANDIHAHNTFDQPDTVRTAKLDLSTGADFVTATFPPGSVVKVELTLQ